MAPGIPPSPLTLLIHDSIWERPSPFSSGSPSPRDGLATEEDRDLLAGLVLTTFEVIGQAQHRAQPRAQPAPPEDAGGIDRPAVVAAVGLGELQIPEGGADVARRHPHVPFAVHVGIERQADLALDPVFRDVRGELRDDDRELPRALLGEPE